MSLQSSAVSFGQRVRWNGYQELIRLTRIARVNGALEAATFRHDAGTIEHRAPLFSNAIKAASTAAGSAVSVVVNRVCT